MVICLYFTVIFGYFSLNAAMYAFAVAISGVQPHQLTVPEVAEPLPPPPPALQPVIPTTARPAAVTRAAARNAAFVLNLNRMTFLWGVRERLRSREPDEPEDGSLELQRTRGIGRPPHVRNGRSS